MSLRDRLRAGSFAVTAEISPPRGAGTDPITATAALLRDWVDAVNVTDNQGSNVRLASWAGSLAALHAGLEPVMQMTCRARNRIARQSDLLGASALGIRNVLVMTGDHPKFGDHPFFFSSRRRHTRCLSDWSSDVCSSDLGGDRRDRRGRAVLGLSPRQ